MTSTKTSLSTTVSAVGILLMLAGVGVAYQFLIPNLKTTKATYAQLVAQDQSLKNETNNLKTAQIDLEQIKSQLSSYNVSLDTINTYFPPTEDIPSLYIQLEAINNSATTLNNVSFQVSNPTIPTTAGESGVIVPVSFNASGQYTDLKQYLASLETNVRPVTFTNISFSVATVASGSNTDPSTAGLTLTASGFVRAAAISSAYSTTTTPK